MSTSSKNIEQAYALASERYAELGVSTEDALNKLAGIPLSLHCWQGDDVRGFENSDTELGGGLAVTGCYPGRARTPDELRADLDEAFSLIPGKHRLNLHACYAETSGRRVDRNELQPEHFKHWLDWARAGARGMDFNPTFFAHPKAAGGFTLSHSDPGIRQFWIEHGIACRKIGEAIGKTLGEPCVTNFWIPDGYKDLPVDRRSPRERLAQSLDTIFSHAIDPALNLDALEPKLFGLGSECYVAGSHEFYLGYALRNHKLLCLDTGHYHPTESIADKISSLLAFLDRLLLHISRGVRWDSDHVVILSDELEALAQEVIRGGYLGRVHIGLDYFDASINRIAAWVIGMRAAMKALLLALLEPIEQLRRLEKGGDFTGRLALLEEAKNLPFGAVWDVYCARAGVPTGEAWVREIRNYEKRVLARRG